MVARHSESLGFYFYYLLFFIFYFLIFQGSIPYADPHPPER